MQASHALLTFTELTIGGPILGIIIGMITLWVLKRIHFDSTSDITITLVACYGVFIIAEGMLPFQVSGILAVVSLGLMLSSSGRAVVADHHHVHEFWEIIEYFGTWICDACACVHVTVAACESRADVNAPHAPVRCARRSQHYHLHPRGCRDCGARIHRTHQRVGLGVPVASLCCYPHHSWLRCAAVEPDAGPPGLRHDVEGDGRAHVLRVAWCRGPGTRVAPAH